MNTGGSSIHMTAAGLELNSYSHAGGRLVAATKTGKVVGWKLQPTAFEEARIAAVPTANPSPAPAAEEAVEEATSTPEAPPPTPEVPAPVAPPRQGSTSGRPEHSARGGGASLERGGLPGPVSLEHGGRQNSRSGRLPPINLVSSSHIFAQLFGKLLQKAVRLWEIRSRRFTFSGITSYRHILPIRTVWISHCKPTCPIHPPPAPS